MTVNLVNAPASGEYAAGITNTNNRLIEQEVNGNIDDGNFAADSPVKVVTSVSGESHRKGKIILLRAGASPYEFVRLVWDSTYDRWISAPQLLAQQQQQYSASGTVLRTSIPAHIPAVVIPSFKALYDAGLRPQLFLSALRDVAINTFLAAYAPFYELADGATTKGSFLGELIIALGPVTEDPPQDYEVTGWSDLQNPVAPTTAHAHLVPEVTGSGGTRTMDNYSVWLRWVAE